MADWITKKSDPKWITKKSDPKWVTKKSDPKWITKKSDPKWITKKGPGVKEGGGKAQRGLGRAFMKGGKV